MDDHDHPSQHRPPRAPQVRNCSCPPAEGISPEAHQEQPGLQGRLREDQSKYCNYDWRGRVFGCTCTATQVITSSHAKIAEIPENNKVIQRRDYTYQIRAINPEHIASLTERAFFNSFNLERVVLNDQEEENSRKRANDYQREDDKAVERVEKVEKVPKEQAEE